MPTFSMNDVIKLRSVNASTSINDTTELRIIDGRTLLLGVAGCSPGSLPAVIHLLRKEGKSAMHAHKMCTIAPGYVR